MAGEVGQSKHTQELRYMSTAQMYHRLKDNNRPRSPRNRESDTCELCVSKSGHIISIAQMYHRLKDNNRPRSPRNRESDTCELCVGKSGHIIIRK